MPFNGIYGIPITISIPSLSYYPIFPGAGSSDVVQSHEAIVVLQA